MRNRRRTSEDADVTSGREWPCRPLILHLCRAFGKMSLLPSSACINLGISERPRYPVYVGLIYRALCPFTYNSKPIPKGRGRRITSPQLLQPSSPRCPTRSLISRGRSRSPYLPASGGSICCRQRGSTLARRGWDDNMERQIIQPIFRSARLGFDIAAALPFAEETR